MCKSYFLFTLFSRKNFFLNREHFFLTLCLQSHTKDLQTGRYPESRKARREEGQERENGVVHPSQGTASGKRQDRNPPAHEKPARFPVDRPYQGFCFSFLNIKSVCLSFLAIFERQRFASSADSADKRGVSVGCVPFCVC